MPTIVLIKGVLYGRDLDYLQEERIEADEILFEIREDDDRYPRKIRAIFFRKNEKVYLAIASETKLTHREKYAVIYRYIVREISPEWFFLLQELLKIEKFTDFFT